MLVPAISDWRSYRGNRYLLWSVCIEDLWFFIPMINFWLILVNVDLTLQNLMVRELLVSRSLFPFPIFDTQKVCQIPFVRVILRSSATSLLYSPPSCASLGRNVNRQRIHKAFENNETLFHATAILRYLKGSAAECPTCVGK